MSVKFPKSGLQKGNVDIGPSNPEDVRVSADGANPVDATHPLHVRPSSDGANPVDATHPLHVRPSADGANPVDAAHPLFVDTVDRQARQLGALSKAGALVSAANPLDVRVSADGVNPVDATHALPVTSAVAKATGTAQASTTQTASGVSATQIDVSTSRSLRFWVDITAASGTTPTLVANLQVRDPLTGNWATIASSVSNSGVTTVSFTSAAAQTLGQFARVSWTIGGTVPSFTFSVGYALEA